MGGTLKRTLRRTLLSLRYGNVMVTLLLTLLAAKKYDRYAVLDRAYSLKLGG